MSTYSRPIRFSDWSSEARTYFREPPPWPYGPGHMSQPALVEMMSSSRYGARSSVRYFPKLVSAWPYGGP